MTTSRGFVMADAVIALLVISVSMTALLNLTFGSARSSEKAEARLTAALVARAIAEDVSTHADEGSVQINGRPYLWERRRDAGSVSHEMVLQLERTFVQVWWNERSEDTNITYNTANWTLADVE